MKANRWISGVVLGALLVSQTLPSQAGRMLCGMKAPERAEACSRCDDSGSVATGGELRARSCCRIVPAEAAESAPVIVSAARRICSEDGTALHLAPAPAVAAGPTFEPARFSATPLTSHPPLESPTRTTVFRN